MTSRGRFTLAALVIAGLAALAWSQWPGHGSAPAAAPRAQPVPAPDPTTARPSPSGEEPLQVQMARKSLAEARARHDRATAEVERAAEEVQAVEDDVASLERYVESLEARGEDPADHAFEAMERFEPVLEKYQSKLAAFELAERTELEALAQVSEAERELERVRGAEEGER